jgi:hypothetical protein
MVHDSNTVKLNAKYHKPPSEWIQKYLEREERSVSSWKRWTHSLDEIGRFLKHPRSDRIGRRT